MENGVTMKGSGDVWPVSFRQVIFSLMLPAWGRGSSGEGAGRSEQISCSCYGHRCSVAGERCGTLADPALTLTDVQLVQAIQAQHVLHGEVLVSVCLCPTPISSRASKRPSPAPASSATTPTTCWPC